MHQPGSSSSGAIARTSFFVLYSVFKERRVEVDNSPGSTVLQDFEGCSPKRDPPAETAGCFTCSRGPDERGRAV